jgi:hypothetical protein
MAANAIVLRDNVISTGDEDAFMTQLTTTAGTRSPDPPYTDNDSSNEMFCYGVLTPPPAGVGWACKRINAFDKRGLLTEIPPRPREREHAYVAVVDWLKQKHYESVITLLSVERAVGG